MARAKSTARAEARRRHRALQSNRLGEGEALPNTIGGLAPGAASGRPDGAAAPARRPFLGFRMPDVRADLPLMPAELRSNRLIWLATVLMLSAPVAYYLSRSVAPDIGGILSLYYTLMVSPPARPVLLAGFVARRGSYIVGFLLGVLNAAVVVVVGTASLRPDAVPSGDIVSISVTYFLYASLMGAVFGGIAGWYRRFLRENNARTRAAREARAAEQRRKAKQEARSGRGR